LQLLTLTRRASFGEQGQIELNYDITVGRGSNIQPTLQYVFRQNAQSNIKDTAVLGVKTHINF
jgi:carbohydrate-selective porin OprB